MRFYQLKNLKAILKTIFFVLIIISCSKKESSSFNKPDYELKKVIRDEYLGLFFNDKKIGYFQGTASEISIKNEPYYLISGTGVIKLDLGNEKIYTILKEEIILSNKYELLYFHYSQNVGESSLEVKGIKKGDSVIIRTYTANKYSDEKLNKDIIPLSSAGFIVLNEGIKEGKIYNFKVFVEAMQKIETLKVEVGKPFFEKNQKIFPLKQKLGNISITSYVYENGETFKEESLQGFTLKKMPRDEALKIDDNTSIYDILSYVSIPVNIKDDIKDIKEIIFEITGIEENIVPPSSYYQRVRRDRERILIHTFTKPFIQKEKISLEKYLKATPKIQSNDREIIETAKFITKSSKTDEEKVRKVVEWVNSNIKKTLKDKTSALEVLRTREGECEAHSMLTSALLRSLNIPTRLVGGIVYSKENKAFLYHAWNEVYLNDHFIPVDSTFGEFPANPTHIKLTEEDNTEDIALYLGRLNLKIIEIKK